MLIFFVTMPDDWEIEINLNPTINDAGEDPDEGGFNNLRGYVAGTEPCNPTSFPGLPQPNIALVVQLLLLTDE